MLPWALAESVCQEVAVFLDLELPPRLARWLEAKAEVCFQKSQYFRRQMGGRGNAPRALLRMYMRHWLAALLGTERRDLWQCLPESFDLGHPLPPGRHPRVSRRRGVMPNPRDWQPERVLTHPRWHWLRRVA